MIDHVEAKGQLKITLTDKDGIIKETRKIKNLVVNVGKEFIASRMSSAALSPISHMAVGAGTVAALGSDVSLGSELSRVSFSSSSTLARTLTFNATFPAGTGTGALTEAGLFNAVSGGVMLARTTFEVFNKTSTDTLAVEWDVTIN